ncbi:MAG TPA: very short patch repair endonuclease [Cytophagales bacterium]|jgi:DNA mismatch endonuclease (patch repair protein)|nr:very short patch repair endonuclease [Cytophagales bacterium]
MPKAYNEQPIKVPRFEENKGFYTTQERSKHMSKIRGKNTKPELMFRKALYGNGVRYRVNVKKLPGKPDIANVSKKFVVFIDGEFWHGFNWTEKKARIKSNRDFWIPKIERNMQRDSENNSKLEAMGFKVFRFWEQEVRNSLDCCVSQVVNYIQTR